MRTTYRLETDEVEFRLYITKKWKDRVWNDLNLTPIFGFRPLLSEDEVNFWRLRTLHWYDLIAERPGVQLHYITEELIEEFVGKTTILVRKTIEDWDNS